MLIPIEDDPDFGFPEDNLDERWLKLASVNCNDIPAKRESTIAEVRRKLRENKIVVSPGDDAQMLMLLRAADSERTSQVPFSKLSDESVDLLKALQGP